MNETVNKLKKQNEVFFIRFEENDLNKSKRQSDQLDQSINMNVKEANFRVE